MSTADTAECLELSGEAVKTRLHRALLCEELLDRAGSPPRQRSRPTCRADCVVAAVFERLRLAVPPKTH